MSNDVINKMVFFSKCSTCLTFSIAKFLVQPFVSNAEVCYSNFNSVLLNSKKNKVYGTLFRS
jgi:hypothetical protein